MEGIISRLTPRGLGFIAPRSGTPDLFFLHAIELRNAHFNECREGDSVIFDLVDGPKGPVAVNVIRLGDVIAGSWSAEKVHPESDRARVTISEVIEGCRKLDPGFIKHLRNHSADIEKLDPYLFEHLVAELMASEGWHEVRLVGRNQMTQADIMALHYIPMSDGIPVRFFVEVKRWKNRIGVEVINQVFGAMVSEREKYGWHGAIIVALGGVSNTRTFSRDEYRNKGIEVRDKEDVMRWLRNYKPNGDGLWVPQNFSNEVEATC